jgi:hypothetical protein
MNERLTLPPRYAMIEPPPYDADIEAVVQASDPLLSARRGEEMVTTQ